MDDFIVHGTYTVANAGGFEIQIDEENGLARVRDAYGSDDPKVSDWLDIEIVDDYYDLFNLNNQTYVIDPSGYNIPINKVIRL